MKEKTIAYAIQVFGNKEAAEKWLNQKNTALNDQKPTELLNTDNGCDAVITVLGQIEDGDLS